MHTSTITGNEYKKNIIINQQFAHIYNVNLSTTITMKKKNTCNCNTSH